MGLLVSIVLGSEFVWVVALIPSLAKKFVNMLVIIWEDFVPKSCRVGVRRRSVYDECVEVEAKLADVGVGAADAKWIGIPKKVAF